MRHFTFYYFFRSRAAHTTRRGGAGSNPRGRARHRFLSLFSHARIPCPASTSGTWPRPERRRPSTPAFRAASRRGVSVRAGIQGKCPHATHTTPSPTRLLTREHGNTLPHTGLSWASSWARAGLGRCVDREREGVPTARKPSPGADLSLRLLQERRSVRAWSSDGRAPARLRSDHGPTSAWTQALSRSPPTWLAGHSRTPSHPPISSPPHSPARAPALQLTHGSIPTQSSLSRSASTRTAPPAPSSPARPSPRPWTCPTCRPPARPPTSPTSSAKWGSSKSCGALSM